MGRVFVLAGAPDPDTIDWSSTELLDHFIGAVARFAGLTEEEEQPRTQLDGPRWRVLPAMNGLPMYGDTTAGSRLDEPSDGQPSSLPYGRAEFLVPTQSQSFLEAAASHGRSASTSFASVPMSFQLPQALPAAAGGASQDMEPTLPLDETTFSEFLEYSLAVHNELPSSLPDLSELPGRGEVAEEEDVRDESTHYDQTTTSFGALSDVSCVPSTQSQTARPALPDRWGPLTDLEAIPGAAYLVSIAPQTATISAVVGVISVTTPRQVHTRWGSTSSLVEVVVGDETRAGFAVSFWTAASGSATNLPPLQPRDVILLRHVALHVFGDRVYGSSLRKDQTKVQVLWRAGDESVAVFSSAELGRARRAAARSRAHTPDALPALLAKTARVRDWALRCIAGGPQPESAGAQDGDQPQRTWDMPPADTQEDSEDM